MQCCRSAMVWCLCVYSLLNMFACSGSGQGTLDKIKYKNYVLEQRKIKDKFFKTSPESPLLEEQQWKFSKLEYYPVDHEFKVVAHVSTLAIGEPVIMKTSTGHDREYFALLDLDFKVKDDLYTLIAYQDRESMEQGSTRYFVPFIDLTAAAQTYGSGRYIDFDYQGGSSVEIDFNFAYNPYCAYNYNYSCPIPPRENQLLLRVEAGEKSFNQ